jgi:hypothetical protein
MPHAAQRAVPEAKVVPLPDIAERLVQMVRPKAARSAGSVQ